MICMHHHHQHHHQYPLKKNKSSSKRGNSTDRSATAWCHFPSLERRLLAITAGPEPRLYLNTTRPLVSSREMKSFCKPTHICYHLLQSRKKPQFRPQWYSPHDHTYNKGFCLADRWPFLPTGFLLWPKALPTCRVSAHGPSYLQVLCSDRQPFLPAGFVLWPTALLTCRFCALLSNSPPYLQVLCSAVQQPSSPAGFELWADQRLSSPARFVICCPTALLTCRFCALSWPVALLTCMFCAMLSKGFPYMQVFCSDQQPSLPAGFPLCADHRRRPGERQTAWSWSTGTAACRTRPVPAAEGCEPSPLCCPGTSDPRGSATGHQHWPSDKLNTKVCVLQQFFKVSKNNAICPYNLFFFSFFLNSNKNKPIWAILCQLPFACRGLSPKDPPPPLPPLITHACDFTWATSSLWCIFEYPLQWCTFSTDMAGVTWNCCRLGAFCVHHTTTHNASSCKATYIRCMRA